MITPSESGDTVTATRNLLTVVPKPSNHQNHLESFLKRKIPKSHPELLTLESPEQIKAHTQLETQSGKRFQI